MVEIDKITGLPKDLLDFGDITKETQKIRVKRARPKVVIFVGNKKMGEEFF